MAGKWDDHMPALGGGYTVRQLKDACFARAMGQGAEAHILGSAYVVLGRAGRATDEMIVYISGLAAAAHLRYLALMELYPEDEG